MQYNTKPDDFEQDKERCTECGQYVDFCECIDPDYDYDCDDDEDFEDENEDKEPILDKDW